MHYTRRLQSSKTFLCSVRYVTGIFYNISRSMDIDVPTDLTIDDNEQIVNTIYLLIIFFCRLAQKKQLHLQLQMVNDTVYHI